METPEEFTGPNNDHSHIVKGKRTKRQRPLSPFGTTSSSSSGGCGGGGGGEERQGDYGNLIPSPTSSGEISTEEEEDMANCLILLAQGGGVSIRQSHEEGGGKVERLISSRKFTDMAATTTSGKAGFYVYACKTCNRTFPSFQALGGHRASHKKPKAMVEEKKAAAIVMPSTDEFYEEGCDQINKINTTPTLPLQIANKSLQGNKSKIHECSVCGSEFTSGQALGGHMRRHRTSASTQITMTIDTSITESHETAEKHPRNILALDLNLPAPEDDHRDSKFQFTPTQQPPLVFSAAPLVDCHY